MAVRGLNYGRLPGADLDTHPFTRLVDNEYSAVPASLGLANRSKLPFQWPESPKTLLEPVTGKRTGQSESTTML